MPARETASTCAGREVLPTFSEQVASSSAACAA